MKSISSHQREAIVRRAVGEREALLAGKRDPEAVFAAQAEAAYRAANPNGKAWTYLDPAEWGIWQRVAKAVLAVPCNRTDREVLLRIRAGIAGDRCDGDTEYASGVNTACRNHLAFIDTVIAEVLS